MRRSSMLGLLVVFCLAGTARAAVNITFEPPGLVARGITPGQKALVFGIGREPITYSTRVHQKLEIVVDSDGDGQVSLPLSGELVGASVWWVVDMASGAASVAAPAAFELRQVAAEDEDLSSLIAPSPELAILHRSLFEVVLVRPGVGAWTARVADGARADADDVYDGTLRVALLALEPFEEGQAALAGIGATDLLLGIDPASLEVLSLLPGSSAVTGGGAR